MLLKINKKINLKKLYNLYHKFKNIIVCISYTGSKILGINNISSDIGILCCVRDNVDDKQLLSLKRYIRECGGDVKIEKINPMININIYSYLWKYNIKIIGDIINIKNYNILEKKNKIQLLNIIQTYLNSHFNCYNIKTYYHIYLNLTIIKNNSYKLTSKIIETAIKFKNLSNSKEDYLNLISLFNDLKNTYLN